MKSCFNSFSNELPVILISIIIFLFTFPRTEPDFGPGLDSSYVWAFNHLFACDYNKLTDLIYPFGPLGFLKMPVPEGLNLAIGLTVFSVLKLLFIISLLYLLGSGRGSSRPMIFPAVITLIISYVCDIDLLITGLTIIYGIMFLRKHNPVLLSISVIMAGFGLFIKSSIGVNSLTVVSVILAINYMNNRNLLLTLKLLFINIALFVLLGYAVFRSLPGFFNYLYNVSMLTSGYSSALALFPENNWFALGIFIITIFLFPVIVKERESRIVWFLMLVPLFIIWKHSMSREDLTHNRILLYFLLFYWGLLCGISKDRRLVLFLIPAVSILAFYRNMSNLPGYNGYKIEIAGINNFYNSVICYEEFNKKYRDLSMNNLQQSKLNPDALSIIGDSTIDFYPWELSYVPANGLNWLPRKTLQSGSFSGWLDRESARSFEPENGPQFILLHYAGDAYGGMLGSIDGRYMLNDEPVTITNIFKYYSIEKNYPGFALFRKKDSPGLSEPESEGTFDSVWDDWIKVPDFGDKLGRVKFSSRINIQGRLKSVFYKPEAFYIDYRFSDEKVMTYRFNRLNAMDGIWISPFYRNSLAELSPEKVTEIRFRCTDKSLFNKKIILEYESCRIIRNPEKVNPLIIQAR